MSRNIKSQFNVGSNQDVESESLLTLDGNNIGEYDKQDIVTNIEFESIVPSIKKHLFYQRMVDFVNKIEFSDQKYHTNGNVRDEHYNEKFLFPMNYFVPLITDCQSMYFISTRFLKYNINGFRAPHFQLYYIHDKIHTSLKQLFKFCH